MAAFARQSSLPLVVLGGLPLRAYPYLITGQKAGDVMEDMCDFYGYTWRRSGDWCVLDPLPGTPYSIASDVLARLESNEPPTFRDLLALSAYDDEALRTLARDYPAVGRMPPHLWPGLRFAHSLTPQQIAAAYKGTLTSSELTQHQQAALRALLVRALPDHDVGEADLILDLSTSDARGESEVWTLSATAGERRVVLLTVTAAKAGAAVDGPARHPDAVEIAEDGSASVLISGKPLQAALRSISDAAQTDLVAEWEIGSRTVSLVASKTTVWELLDALARALGAIWRQEGGRRILARDSGPAEPKPGQSARSSSGFLDQLLELLPLDDVELQTIAAIDPELSAQLNRKGFSRYALEAYAALPREAVQSIRTSGRWTCPAAALAPEIRASITRGLSHLTVDGKPVVREEGLQAESSVVEFRRDGDLITLTAWTPQLPDGLTQRFGPGSATQYAPVAHLAARPWYLRFPKEVPPEFVAHLSDVRGWRGELGLRHVAPLAFMPREARARVVKQVPEAACIHSQNEKFLMLYALLDADQRRKVESPEGLPGQQITTRTRSMLLGILGHPDKRVSNADFATSSIRVVRETGKTELQCEFRCVAGSRTVSARVGPPDPVSSHTPSNSAQ